MTKIEFTSTDYRQGLEKFLEALGRRAQVSIDFLEGRFSEFVREHCDKDFPGLYEIRDLNYFARWESMVKRDRNLYKIITKDEPLIGRAFKTINAFYASKYLPKQRLKPNSRRKVEDMPLPSSLNHPVKDFPTHNEGARKEMELERAFRNRKVRNECISYWGAQCQVCGLRFTEDYGELGADFIEVHHLVPISSKDGEYEVDPVNDLVPLCSNCHSMIHRGGEMPMPLSELREKYKGLKRKIERMKL